MKRHHLFFLCLAAVSFGSCRSSTAPPLPDPVTIQDLFPLAHQDYWAYELTYYDMYDTLRIVTTDVDEVIQTTNFNGQESYLMDYRKPARQLYYYYAGSDLMVTEKNSAAEPILRYPMHQGEVMIRRDTTYSSGIRDRNILKFTGASDTIKVTAGIFSCYHYQAIRFGGKPDLSDTSEVEHLYYAPGVGLIKRVRYQYTQDHREKKIIFTQELMNYNVL